MVTYTELKFTVLTAERISPSEVSMISFKLEGSGFFSLTRANLECSAVIKCATKAKGVSE